MALLTPDAPSGDADARTTGRSFTRVVLGRIQILRKRKVAKRSSDWAAERLTGATGPTAAPLHKTKKAPPEIAPVRIAGPRPARRSRALTFRRRSAARRASWVLLIGGLTFSANAPAARLKDITDVQGVRDNDLFGYGLVVGLGGSGDSDQVLFTTQSLGGLLGRLGVRVSAADIHVRNVAAVMVTARLPPFARAGTRLDVSVSSIGNARSLAGGILLITPLNGADGQVHAVAQGAVQVGGYSVAAFGSSLEKNQPTSGRVPLGGTVELAVMPSLSEGPIVLDLRQPDFTNASRIAAAVSAAIPGVKARSVDAASVEVTPPPKQDLIDVLAKLEAIDVETDQRAKVVVSERTGTVVAGEHVRLHPVAVAHGGIRVAITTTPYQSQRFGAYGTGASFSTRQTAMAVDEVAGKAISLPATGTIDELVKGLNLLGVSPRDLVAILQAIEAAGALDGDLEVI
jgi:flagellar P-ring protein precursor FlgI